MSNFYKPQISLGIFSPMKSLNGNTDFNWNFTDDILSLFWLGGKGSSKNKISQKSLLSLT
uniref:Uncharacterized protein n=1 Tax=Nelumbo nucifera TaxID=4432 RepID=A0A822XWW5_NELNU|nr:TPA_asm: hypothetical protein HUJ06_025114 [Nelumbo nucifera]